MSKLFISFMRELGLEPNKKDIDHFEFMAKDYVESLIVESCMNAGVEHYPEDVASEFAKMKTELKLESEKLDKACGIIEKVLDSGDYSRETESILRSF